MGSEMCIRDRPGGSRLRRRGPVARLSSGPKTAFLQAAQQPAASTSAANEANAKVPPLASIVPGGQGATSALGRPPGRQPRAPRDQPVHAAAPAAGARHRSICIHACMRMHGIACVRTMHRPAGLKPDGNKCQEKNFFLKISAKNFARAQRRTPCRHPRRPAARPGRAGDPALACQPDRPRFSPPRSARWAARKFRGRS